MLAITVIIFFFFCFPFAVAREWFFRIKGVRGLLGLIDHSLAL